MRKSRIAGEPRKEFPALADNFDDVVFSVANEVSVHAG
jgi:hypothetical protein